ncbi:MAG TPA: choice-of-anchor D domain-containing protein [Verrucomicrobiae bacterium]|nr:choice-of-anchor D domain-containing protein [Verrucomicrobiae bacterium]
MLLPPSSIRRLFLSFVGLALVFFLAGASATAQNSSSQLVSSASLLKFGWLAIGQTETQVVVLTNSGSSAIQFSSISVSKPQFRVSGAALPMTIASGNSVALYVSFTPTATGWVAGQIGFNSNASDSNLILPVRGTGVAKNPVTASPANLSFGQVAVGGSKKLSVTLTNNCLCTQTLSSLQSWGSGFVVSDPPFPLTLARGQTVTFSVAFDPQAAGVAGGSLMINGPDVSIPLSGTGISSVAGQLNVSPGTLSFGSVVVGETATESATLSATGASVTVNSASSSNSQFALPGASFPLTIAAGTSVSLQVTFTPSAAGSDSANLTFVSNASNSSAVETVSGTANMPYVSLSWSPSTSDVAGYNVYRGTSSNGPFSKLNSSIDTNTTYSDSSVALNTTYYYATTAVSSSGQESTYSNLVEVKVP